MVLVERIVSLSPKESIMDIEKVQRSFKAFSG